MTEKYVTIPETKLAEFIYDRAELATMLCNLIVIWKHEEKLKQHHRPYLYVRKETEKLWPEMDISLLLFQMEHRRSCVSWYLLFSHWRSSMQVSVMAWSVFPA